jgi:hypothetical protein
MKKEKKSKKRLKSGSLFDCKNSEILYFCRKLVLQTSDVCKTLNNKAEKEITLFPKNRFSFSFKPFLILQGAVVFLFAAKKINSKK